ncbi:MAG: flippase-like domain-containing protein [Clostridia bacterium]|nr:flippase-like domain-containing protein [Clostridia bacterium]
MNRKQLVRTIGNLLMVVAVVFILYKLYQYREAFFGVFNWKIGCVMLLSALFTAFTFVVMGVLYGSLVGRISGGKAPTGLTARIYCKSNLYKYIPGNVLQYVGRNQIAEFTKARHDQVVLASVIEVAAQATGALLVSLFLARGYVLDWFNRQNKTLIIGTVALGVMVVAAVLVILIRKKKKLMDELRGFLIRKNLLYMLGLLGFIVVTQIVNGGLFVWLMHCMVPDLPQTYWNNIAGVYCFAWLVGFITPGAPGGMGIREAMLSVLLTNVILPEMITAAIVLNRIVTICGDVIAFFISKLFARGTESGNRYTEVNI